MKVFNLDSPVYNFLSRMADLLILNLLWAICSLPIITIGAATISLYYVMLKIHRGEDTGLIQMFFQSFRCNLKQGCVLTVILGVSGLAIFIDLQLSSAMHGNDNLLTVLLFVILFAIWGIVCSYSFPLLAQFNNSIFNTMKNALFLGIFNFGRTLLILMLNLMPITVLFLFPAFFQYCLPVIIAIGMALIARINTILFTKIFDVYINEDATN